MDAEVSGGKGMDEGLTLVSEELELPAPLAAGDEERLEAALRELSGVETVSIANNRLIIGYYAEVVSSQAICARIAALGFGSSPNAKPKGAVKRFLDRMAESNRAAFGSEPPDCCTLNRKQASRS